MHIVVNSNDQKLNVDIHFDICGNLYFEYNNLIYQVNIDHKNVPYLDQFNYDIITPSNDKINKFKIITADFFKMGHWSSYVHFNRKI